MVVVPSAAVLSIVASMALAQVPQSLRGKIENVANQTLVVKARDGTEAKVMLADDVHIFKLEQASLGDLKQGSVVGATAIGQMSGPEKAVEIYIFPDDPKREPNVPTKVVGRENEIPNLSTAPPRTQRTLMRATTPANPDETGRWRPS